MATLEAGLGRKPMPMPGGPKPTEAVINPAFCPVAEGGSVVERGTEPVTDLKPVVEAPVIGTGSAAPKAQERRPTPGKGL